MMRYLAFSMVLAFATNAISDDLRGPELVKSLVAAGDRTQQRVATEGVAWSAIHDTPGGISLRVDIEAFPNARSYVFFVVEGGKSAQILSVLMQDQLWFVDDGTTRGIFRPFESPFPIPTAALFLVNSEFVVLSQLQNGAVVSAELEDAQRVVVRFRGSASRRATMSQALAKLQEFHEKLRAAGREVPASQVQRLEEVSEILKSGFTTVVDQTTGVILDQGGSEKKVHIRNFRFIGKQPGNRFRVEREEWVDHTRPFTVQEMQEVIQIGHSRLWYPGAPSGGDSDLLLLNVRTGKQRRVPFSGGLAMSGCFSKDRTRVYVPGTSPVEGSFRIFEVDLQQGTTSPIGDDDFSSGIWMNPVISPDERFLAAMQLFAGEGRRSQLHLIDLKTHQSRKIGEPQDIAFLAWHPNANHLLCADRVKDPQSDRTRSFISAVNLNGDLRHLRPGAFPSLLPQQQRILFEDEDDGRLLKTCDLEGKDVKLFGDGFRGYGFSTASPDGQRLALMKFVAKKAPQLCLVDLKTFEVTPVELPRGMWSRPVWK